MSHAINANIAHMWRRQAREQEAIAMNAVGDTPSPARVIGTGRAIPSSSAATGIVFSGTMQEEEP
jgi:hypothetical protein